MSVGNFQIHLTLRLREEADAAEDKIRKSGGKAANSTKNGRFTCTVYLPKLKKRDSRPGQAGVGDKARNSRVAASSSVLPFRRCSDRFTQYSISDLSVLPKQQRTPTFLSPSPSLHLYLSSQPLESPFKNP